MKEIPQFLERDPGFKDQTDFTNTENLNELKKMKEISKGDVEVLHYLVNKKIAEIIDKKKKNEISRDELIKQRSLFDEHVDYATYVNFKNKELIDTFSFQGDEIARDHILNLIKEKGSISDKGSNHKGVFDLPDNKIVKIVSKGNYPYELPMVNLTKNLNGKNVIKTYDVFERGDLVYIVQDKAFGKDIHEYSKDELDMIPQEHYDDLVSMINMYASLGIGTDPSKISNLFYDPEKGFSVIDLGAATYQRGLDYHIDGYFTNNLSKDKIEKAIEKFGEYKLKPILPTLQDKLKKLSIE